MIDNLEALKKKMAYMYSIDEALTNPHEVWYHPEDETTYYLLKLEGEITIVAKVKAGIFQDFEVIESDFDKVNALRSGILKHVIKHK